MKPQESEREVGSRGARLGEAGHTFPAPPIPPADRPGQFSIAAILLATGVAAVLLSVAKMVFATQGDLIVWILSPIFVIGAIYICLRLPFILTALARRREYYRALQRHRAELAAWTEERKGTR